MVFPIILMIVGLIFIIMGSIIVADEAIGAMPIVFGLIFIIGSMVFFKMDFQKQEDERLLKVLVTQHKVDLKLTSDGDFGYTLIDTAFADIYGEIHNSTLK